VTLVMSAAAMAITGCGGPGEPTPTRSTDTGPALHDHGDGQSGGRAKAELIPARCPVSADNCEAATGRIVYVERVDPDGDGDLHVVLLAARSLSAPGVTVLDVSRALRPARDPAIGDLATGSGPVYRGSYGQRQIQVTTFRVAR
jgi:hypothetical protein